MTINQEISELAAAINRTRLKIDNLRKDESGVQIPNIDKEKHELYEQYRQAVEALEQKRQQKVEIKNAIALQRQTAEFDLDEQQKRLAELTKLAQEQQFLQDLVESVQEYIVKIGGAWDLIADFQKEDILETVRAYRLGKNGMLNANDMGLGKTVEALLSLVILAWEFEKDFNRKPRILWLTKQSLIFSTIKEFHKWYPEFPVFAVPGSMTPEVRDFMVTTSVTNGLALVSNYEIMNTTKIVREMDWDIVVIDECHKLKGGANARGNDNKGASQIWTNAKEVCRRSRFMIMLSGTPMVNHPKEMWAYLHIFDPERFPNMKRFENMFGKYDYIEGMLKLDADKLLKGALMGQCIRRRKDEVGIQLPSLIHAYRYLEMTEGQRALYDQMKQNFFIWLGKQEDSKPLTAAAIIAQLTRLRQISVWPGSIRYTDEDGRMHNLECNESSKVNEAIDIVSELNDEGENVVIFSTFNEPLREIQRRCRDMGITCELVTGDSHDLNVSTRFQNNEIRVLGINMAMSEGLNLQKTKDWPGGASNAIMMDLWWTPARNEQAEARIHRTGATENCTIHILHNEDSVDAFIAAKIEEKSEMFASILERKEVRPASDWKKLLEGLL